MTWVTFKIVEGIFGKEGHVLKDCYSSEGVQSSFDISPKPLGVAEDENIWQSRERNQVVCEELAQSSEKSCSFYLL